MRIHPKVIYMKVHSLCQLICNNCSMIINCCIRIYHNMMTVNQFQTIYQTCSFFIFIFEDVMVQTNTMYNYNSLLVFYTGTHFNTGLVSNKLTPEKPPKSMNLYFCFSPEFSCKYNKMLHNISPSLVWYMCILYKFVAWL